MCSEYTEYETVIPCGSITLPSVPTLEENISTPHLSSSHTTRKLVLKGVDGIVFVADSQTHRKFSNIESYNNLEENLLAYQKDLKDIPHVIQYNKIDLPNIIKSEELNQIINKYNAPYFQTCAITGIGIMDSLKSISKLVFAELNRKGITSKSYLIEKTPIEKEEAVEAIEEKETPFVSEEEVIEPNEKEIIKEQLEELSSNDIEIVEDDLSIIEPNYKGAIEASEFESYGGEEILREREEEIISNIEKEESKEDFVKESNEVEFSPEHFETDIKETEQQEERIFTPPKEASFEELEDLGPFVQLEEETNKETKEEDAFTDLINQAMPEELPQAAEEKLDDSLIEVIEDTFETEAKEEADSNVIQESFIQEVPSSLIQQIQEEEKDEKQQEEEALIKEQQSYLEKIIEDKIDESFSIESDISEPGGEIIEELPHEEFLIDTAEVLNIEEQIPEEKKEESVSEIISEYHEEVEKEIIDKSYDLQKEKTDIESIPKEETYSKQYNVFSYSILLDDINLKELMIALENSIIDNQQNELYKFANDIFNKLIEELSNKIEIQKAMSIIEKLIMIGIPISDYRYFIKNMTMIKKGQTIDINNIYYIHNFIANLILKIRNI